MPADKETICAGSDPRGYLSRHSRDGDLATRLMHRSHTAPVRSKLFVPGTRPELFDKAVLTGADAVSFDLEDAVALDRKADGRDAVARWLAPTRTAAGPLTIVRVNALDTAFFAADLAAMAVTAVDIVNLPKIESPDEVAEVAARLAALERESGRGTPIGLLVNIETPKGLRRAAEIASADPRIVGLQIGYGDLFEPFGIDRGELDALNAVRFGVRLAAAEAGLPAYDGAFVGVDDLDGFRRECLAARRYGLAGKSCIHPTQVAIANEVFQPSANEVEHARRLLTAADAKLADGIGAFTLDGSMVDGPFIARARAVLALAGRASPR